MEGALLAALREAKLDTRTSPVFVQSFETTNLRELDEAGVRVPLVQLLGGRGGPADLAAEEGASTYDEMATAEGLARIAEDTFLPPALQDLGEAPDDYGRAIEEHLAYGEAGVDGMFTGNPDTGVVSRDLFEG